jgi:hypothetical protein
LWRTKHNTHTGLSYECPPRRFAAALPQNQASRVHLSAAACPPTLQIVGRTTRLVRERAARSSADTRKTGHGDRRHKE